MYISRLSNSMAAILRLSVHRWVPIAIVENYGISTCQVNTDAAGPGGQDKAEYPPIGVEPLHQDLEVRRYIMSIRQYF